jgi:hypothetical protein
MKAAVVVPYRDRGRDPLRAANLQFVQRYVESLDIGDVLVVDDGRSGDDQFCRSRAYNLGGQATNADVLVYYESDMIVPRSQLTEAIALATQQPGLVVPFNRYHGLSRPDAERVRAGADPSQFEPEVVIPNRNRSWLRTGPLNVISRQTLQAVGRWDEQFAGSHFDDRAMNRAFEVCCGPTRHVDGTAYHLWHVPGWTGSHLTVEDKAATTRNRRRFARYQRAHTPDQICQLTSGAT